VPVNLALFKEIMTLLDKKLSRMPSMSEVEKYLPVVWRSDWFQALRRFVTTKEMTITVPYKHYRLVSIQQLEQLLTTALF
jgi:hypothetical protein